MSRKGGVLCDPPQESNEKCVQSEDEGKSVDGVSQLGDAPIEQTLMQLDNPTSADMASALIGKEIPDTSELRRRQKNVQ
jgi:hypothetical protein